MALAANAVQLEAAVLSIYTSDAEAALGWADALVAYFKTMDRLPGTDAVLDSLQPSIMSALTGISVFSPQQSAVKIQAGFAAAWSGISVNAATLYAGAASATPPPTVATIAATVLPVVFAANMIPGVTREQAATTLANALSAANATGGFWVLSAGGTAPIT